jgi:membrane protein DedA with SNARE-associated domain
MNAIVQLLVKHGYSVLFASVFARQMCLPVPAILFLIAAGALAGSGRMTLAIALGLAIMACLLADMMWYEAGRRWGDQILHFIYGLALDPDAAARRSKETFARHGPRTLMLAKFVVGLDAATPPLAGVSGSSRLRFIAFDTVGAALWSGACAGLGYVLGKDLDRAAAYASQIGHAFGDRCIRRTSYVRRPQACSVASLRARISNGADHSRRAQREARRGGKGHDC